MQISYENTDYEVRPNFAEGHARCWQRLASPGNWFSGAERVAIAQEVRNAPNCKLCQDRKVALSPNMVKGDHDTITDLPQVIVDVVHRIITDPNRLTKTWFKSVIHQGVSVGQYVEVVGVLVHVYMIDEFCRAIGVEAHELPEPTPGETSRYEPGGLEDAGAWIPLLKQQINDQSPEADLAGKLTANVIRALSLIPDDVRTVLDLIEVHYLASNDIVSFGKSYDGPLTRFQMELIATRVSSYNDCFY